MTTQELQAQDEEAGQEGAGEGACFEPLAAFAEDAVIAVGAGGAVRAAALRRDVLAVAARLPPAAPGSEIEVICADRYHFAVGVLAAWEAGHAVALPPNTQPEVVRALAARPGVLLLLHDTDAAEGADLRGWLGEEAEARPGRRLAPIAAGRVCATVYTSGSSGEHQACPKTARQLLGEAAALAATFGVGPGERIVATVPPHHIYGLLFGTLLPLAAGASFVRTTPFHAETIAATARELEADVLVSVPVHLRSLTVLEAAALAGIRRVFSSGAPLPEATAAALSERFGLAVVEVFGSSETGGIAWRVAGPGEPWRPFAGVRVDVDAGGRLLLDSPFLPPAEPRPFVGGDRVALREDGRFDLLGRYDGVIKVGSKRVSLAEVEARLLGLPEVADAAVAATVVGGARGHELIAAVVLRAPARAPSEAIAELRRGLLQWFDPVVVPRRIKVVDILPREANGKLRRQRLLELLEVAREPATAASAAAGRVLARFEIRRSFPEARCFVVRSHAVRACRGRELHEVVVRSPLDPEDRAAPALARLLGQVLARIGGFGRPRRLSGAGLGREVPPGAVIVIALTVERARRRVGFELRCGDERWASGVADYAGAREVSGG